MILLLFAFGRCSSGLGICFTINISACATTLSAFMEKCTNGFITLQVSPRVSCSVTVSFSGRWPIFFWFDDGMADGLRGYSGNRAKREKSRGFQKRRPGAIPLLGGEEGCVIQLCYQEIVRGVVQTHIVRWCVIHSAYLSAPPVQ